MLREGWDVRNVVVIVPLRPLTAAAKILPEQTLGRGLRLMGGAGSGWDEKLIVIEHEAFRDFWDKELKGKLGSWGGDFRTNMWYAALHTGQSPNNITDLNAVWDALKKQRGLMKKYWASGSELMSLLGNGEIYATVAWSGRVAALQKQGHPIGYLAPDGTYSWMEYMYVLKGTDLDVAQKLLNFMLEPAAAIAVAKGQNYPPSLDPRKVPIPDVVKKLPAFDPTGELNGYLFADPAYWNSHQVEWAEKWDRIRAGG